MMGQWKKTMKRLIVLLLPWYHETDALSREARTNDVSDRVDQVTKGAEEVSFRTRSIMASYKITDAVIAADRRR